MQRLIDANKLLSEVMKTKYYHLPNGDIAIPIIDIEHAPTVDAVPVVHGRWTTKRTQEHDGEWYCSACGYEPIVMTDDMIYCPGCGAKMDEERSENGNHH